MEPVGLVVDSEPMVLVSFDIEPVPGKTVEQELGLASSVAVDSDGVSP